MYSLHQAKEITKKVCHNMPTIFMNSENSQTSEPFRLLIKFADKIV